MTPLPISPAFMLGAAPPERRWLIEDLWSLDAVGIVGGEPKCCKSFLALDIAVSVAAGTPCLRRFPIGNKGPVLLYCAEDALHIVRSRLEGICHAAAISLETLDLHVITAPSLRLDLDTDQARLADALQALRPVLLVLDPFVRLHRIDENSSGEVAPLLAYLRDLQRRFSLSVVLVHHSRKSSGHLRAGQALRGSSEFHAWGDSNLYLRRQGDTLTLTTEHRAAASLLPLSLSLRADGPHLALHILDSTDRPTEPAALSPSDKIQQALSLATQPLPLAALRQACRIRTAHLCSALAQLTLSGLIHKTPAGYKLAT